MAGDRRDFLRRMGHSCGVMAFGSLPANIQRALAIPARSEHRTLQDVQHVVILMQENRSFDHYFGTLRGVRGFGDRHTVPLASGRPVWYQSDGAREIPPFHLDTQTTSAIRAPGTPHAFSNAQAAWSQGQFGFWPKFKTPYSMGYYKRADIPFQFALAEAFTLCDAYHCSITTGTDPNRIMFWSGSNFDPQRRARKENCTDADSEPDNLRCWIEGKLPEPGYTYAGSALTWPTIPDVLERAGISWRIYQDPNDNWTGAMHGCLAFESFRTAGASSPLYQKGMAHWSLEALAEDVRNDRLPQVSWVLPPELWSEHPAPSSPLQGAEFTAHVLDALTSNPEVWSRTVFFINFDENDGLFDHVPPPAPPSYNPDGTLAGKSTLDLGGLYFSDPERKHLAPNDSVSGTVRPWGLGPRVPAYVVSPWSRGGWVTSQVFDHTSMAQFLEKRFRVHIPAISPWHRAVSGDLTSAFDFEHPNQDPFPKLPDTSGSAAIVKEHSRRPKPTIPAIPETLLQEPGTRPSRALPYELQVSAHLSQELGTLWLELANTGRTGAVLHVYDKLHLDRIPRRYTIEAGKHLRDSWDIFDTDDGSYDLWVYGPNDFLRELRGKTSRQRSGALPETELRYDVRGRAVILVMRNTGAAKCQLTVKANAYRDEGPWGFEILPGTHVEHRWSVAESGNWYDFLVMGELFHRRCAGRLETGAHSTSDPARAAGG